ncbi:hypothetical protein R70006_06214 [Paraburkholderia domus]|uniref:H-NS histone family protein n=1 Tax=Paraburkholderia domus TaxID=2793075 RepID=UPI001911AA0F|nr:H-NS histone family protein [Paraburkholderia domus]MBK5052846.1 H-NS histone family protein [Burkholderia sp. R-70006]CAE6821365.1 hypothetical protein R70006_06214 [Paraburkholderia domus]
MADSYTALKTQLDKLAARTEKARAREAVGVLKDLRKKIAEFGFSAEDLFGEATGKKGVRKKADVTAPQAETKTAKPPKYQDPKSGATWSGFGRAPAWIAKTRNRDRFLVAGAQSAE